MICGVPHTRVTGYSSVIQVQEVFLHSLLEWNWSKCDEHCIISVLDTSWVAHAFVSWIVHCYCSLGSDNFLLAHHFQTLNTTRMWQSAVIHTLGESANEGKVLWKTHLCILVQFGLALHMTMRNMHCWSMAVACHSHMVQSQQCHSWCLKSTKGNMLFSLVPRLEEEEEKGLGLAPPLWPGTEATCLRYRGTANLYFSDTCRKIFFLANKSWFPNSLLLRPTLKSFKNIR